MTIDYRNLPDEVRRELLYEVLKSTKLAIALSNSSGETPEVWMERASVHAFRDLQSMSEAEIDAAIAQFEQAKQGYGVQRVNIDQPKGFGK